MNYEISQVFTPMYDSDSVVEIFKTYYLKHPELQLEVPRTHVAPALPEELYTEVKKYLSSYTDLFYDAEFQADDLIDHWNYEIEAFLHINYVPALYHTHSYYELIYVLEGECNNYSGSKMFHLVKGDVMILAPGATHAISVFNDDCRLVNLIIHTPTFEKTFYGIFSKEDIFSRFFSKLLSAHNVNRFLLFHTIEDETIMLAILKLLEMHNNSRHQRYTKIAYVTLLFSQLLTSYMSDMELYIDEYTKVHEYIPMLFRYLQKNYKEATLDSTASFFGYSTRHLSRLLTQATGYGFQENLQIIRIANACRYLEETDYSIEKIAELCGYSSARNFRAMFLKYKNITPRDYRKGIHVISRPQ